MSYEATVFNVMIASPGDVPAERSIARDVITEWNAVHSASREIVLMPTGWESHTSPEMGDAPQSIVNKQVPEKCDLLIGVFWTKIGTRTKEYASGTVEEIERHIESGKPTMLYFSNQPARLDSVDDGQYQELKKFKASCRERGIYEKYDSHSQFKEKFYRQLQLKLNEHPDFAPISRLGQELPLLELRNAARLPTLSGKARHLLKGASKDSNGIIMYLRHMDGTDLETNGKNLIKNQSRRTIAKWEAALQELVDEKLVVERDLEGEIIEITERGFQVAGAIAT